VSQPDTTTTSLPVLFPVNENIPETGFGLNQYQTLSSIVRDVAVQVGIPRPEDPAGSEDPAVQQMVAAVNMAAQDMFNLYDWQQLVKKYEIEIEADEPGQREKSFDLPADFWAFIDQTQWNKDTRLPAIGPISPQMWMQINVRMPMVVLTFLWQIRDDKLWIQSPPEKAQTLTFMYISRGWCRDAEDPAQFKRVVDKNSDLILFDPYLMTLLTRVKWLDMKGFDSSKAMQDFRMNYEIRKGKREGAPVLSTTTGGGLPLLNMLTNVPDTGYGSLGQK